MPFGTFINSSGGVPHIVLYSLPTEPLPPPSAALLDVDAIRGVCDSSVFCLQPEKECIYIFTWVYSCGCHSLVSDSASIAIGEYI